MVKWWNINFIVGVVGSAQSARSILECYYIYSPKISYSMCITHSVNVYINPLKST